MRQQAQTAPGQGPPCEEAPTTARPWVPSRKTLLRVGLALLLAVAAVVVGQKFLHMKSLLDAVESIDPHDIALSLMPGLVYYLLKALRWHYYLRAAGIVVPVRRSVAAYLAGPWFTFTPAGELMRACLLGSGTDFKLVAPTVVAQAIADFLSLALIATLVVPLYPALAPVVLPVTVPILITAVMAAAPPLRRFASGWQFVQWLASGKRRETMESAAHLLGARPMAVGLLMGIPTVLAGGLALYFAGLAVHLPDWQILQAEGVYSIIQLLVGISPLPQGLGVTEGSGALLLTYLGVDAEQALVAVILYRAVVLGFSAALGLLAFLLLRVRE